MTTVRMDDARPTYRRLADDLREQIRTGQLEPGTRVPSARQLARERGVAQMTASQALQVLQREGLVFTVVGRGSFVAVVQPDVGPPQPEVSALAKDLAALERRVRALEERAQNHTKE